MAKKKEEGLKYLQMPLPPPSKEKTVVKVNWSGLNKTQTLDTGELSLEENISTLEAPYLTPSPKRTLVDSYVSPICMFGFDDFLIVIYKSGSVIRIDHITNIDGDATIKRGVLNTDGTETGQRSAVIMNILDTTVDITVAQYIKELIIFPDKMQIPCDLPGSSLSVNELILAPEIHYATVFNSRIVGVGHAPNSDYMDRVFVSNFNDLRWQLDSELEFNESNAWESPAQSNVKATGEFTGIATYLNSVVTFKKDYMHEVIGRSSSNFRINDIYAEGAIDNRSVLEVDGNLIFVSDDAVKIYTGGNPRIISYKLNVKRYVYATAGTDGRRYFLYCEDENSNKHLFVYDTFIMAWAEEVINSRVISFAKNSVGFYMLTDEGNIYRIDTDNYIGQPWAAETDLSAGRTIDIKHVQKIQILADIAPNSTIKAYLLPNGEEFDSSVHLPVYEFTNGNTQKKTTIRVVPRKTAHWGTKLRLSGTGYCRIYQAEITLKGGGELFA